MIKIEKIGVYDVTFDGVNVTINGRTLTVWQWLALEMGGTQDYRVVVDGAKCHGLPVFLSNPTFNALHRALVIHAQTLCQPQEFWIYRIWNGQNYFSKAFAESSQSFAVVHDDGFILACDKSLGWSRVDAPWWEYTCPVCGKKHKAFIDKDIAGRIYFPDGSCGADIADNLDSHLKVKANGKFYSCDLKPGKWNPELKEEVKRAIRVRREFCSQCDGLVFQEDKKCRQCGAEFDNE